MSMSKKENQQLVLTWQKLVLSFVLIFSHKTRKAYFSLHCNTIFFLQFFCIFTFLSICLSRKKNRTCEYDSTKNKPGPTKSCCDESAFDCPVPDGLFPCSDNCSQYFICDRGDPRYRKKCWIRSKNLDSLMAWLGEKRKTEFS